MKTRNILYLLLLATCFSFQSKASKSDSLLNYIATASEDGMDIALCSLKLSESLELSESCATLQYAGANNPLWIVRNNEFIEIKPNKQPIGKVDNPQPFTTHTIELQKEDAIYIFTDGFPDQFGGEKSKKLMYKPFKSLLLSIQDKTMENQKTVLEQYFENWKGSLEQVDDVCVIGVRI